MFHIQWGAVSQSRGRGQRIDSPFREMEMEMNSFRNAAVSNFFGEHDPLTASFEDEIENLIDNSRNLMSMLPVMPSDRNVTRRGQGAPRRYRRNRNSDRNVFELSEPAIVHPPQEEYNSNTRRRGNSLRNFLDRNNHVFPAPQADRRVWYDPNEPTPENRIPHIPPRVLTLAQINRIPTKKVTKAGGSCDICLDDFQKGETTKVLNCKHDYHSKCVDPWLKQHTTCPKCRRQVRAPPENKNRHPRPVPPPCPARERARAYDRERRGRVGIVEATQQQNIETAANEVETSPNRAEVQTVVDLPSVENPSPRVSPRAATRLTTEFPVVESVPAPPEQNADTTTAQVTDGNDQTSSESRD